MNRRLFLLAGLAVASGCATAAPPSLSPASRSLSELEPLYSVTAGRDALTIRVASNGCTRKEDFSFFLERDGEAVSLAFGRKRVDPCRSLAMGHADLTFTYQELGVAQHTPLFLLNPFAAWTGPGS